VARAPAVFGLGAVNPALNPNSVEALAADLGARATPLQQPAAALLAALRGRAERLGVAAGADRLRTAEAGAALVAALAGAGGTLARIGALADTEVPTTDQALGSSLTGAAALQAALTDERWALLDGVLQAVEGDAAAERIAVGLRTVFERDEFAEKLAPAIGAAYEAAVKLVMPTGGTGSGGATGTGGGAVAGRFVGTPSDARTKLDELEQAGVTEVSVEWTARP
jgi:hypothetical protein